MKLQVLRSLAILVSMFSGLVAYAETPRLLEADAVPKLAPYLPARHEIAPILAPSRWTRAVLTETLGAPTETEWGSVIWHIDGQKVTIWWRDDGSLRQAHIESAENSRPRAGKKPRVPSGSTTALTTVRDFVHAANAPFRWLGRPSVITDELAIGGSFGVPQWHFETGEGRCVIVATDKGTLKLAWSVPTGAMAAGSDGQGEGRGTWRRRPPVGATAATPVVAADTVLPFGLSPDMGLAGLVARFGSPLEPLSWNEQLSWAGLGAQLRNGRLRQVELNAAFAPEAVARALGMEWFRALTAEVLRARLGAATFDDVGGNAAHWIFERVDGGGLLHISRDRHVVAERLKWTFIDGTSPETETCPTVCIPRNGPDRPDPRRERLLSGVVGGDCGAKGEAVARPSGYATCGWRAADGSTRSLHGVSWRSPAEKLRPVALIDPLMAAAVRKAFPADPVASALGEPAAVWIERFGAPDHSDGNTLVWFLASEAGLQSAWLRVTARDLAQRGVIDDFGVAWVDDGIERLLSGFDVFNVARGVSVFGPPDAGGVWNAAVRHDSAQGTLTIEHADTLGLVRWLRQKGLGGAFIDALGRPVAEAFAVLRKAYEHGIRTRPGDDGRSLVLEIPEDKNDCDGFGRPKLTLTCAGPLMQCQRLEIGWCRND
jgi:hypothetical protein